MDELDAATDGGFSTEEENTEDTSSESEGGSLRDALLSAWDDSRDGAAESEPAETPVSDQTGEKKGVEPATQALEPPNSWSKEARESWNLIPRRAQEELLKRQLDTERTFTSKTQQLAKEREEWEQKSRSLGNVHQILEPHVNDLHLRGVDPVTWLNEVMAIDKLARKDKRAALAHLAQQWGVNPAELSQAQQVRGQAANLPPVLTQTLQQYGQKLQQLEQSLTSRQRAEEQARLTAAEKQVNEWSAEADESGNPLRPHYASLEKQMTFFASEMLREDPNKPVKEVLQEAYDRAAWADPKIRAEIQAAEQKAKEEQTRQDAAKRVSAAKKAGSPIVGGPNGKTMAAAKTLREQLEAAFDESAH